jgi:hypothetical protein
MRVSVAPTALGATKNERDTLTETLNRTDPTERTTFLDQACAGNPELRSQRE